MLKENESTIWDLVTFTPSDPNLILNASLQRTSIFTPVLKYDDNLFQVLTRSSEPKIYLSDDIRWYLTISDTFSTKKLPNRTNWSARKSQISYAYFSEHEFLLSFLWWVKKITNFCKSEICFSFFYTMNRLYISK